MNVKRDLLSVFDIFRVNSASKIGSQFDLPKKENKDSSCQDNKDNFKDILDDEIDKINNTKEEK